MLGQKVIWDALRAAVTALENSDLQLAQAIIDGANITLPHGKMFKKFFLSKSLDRNSFISRKFL